MSVLMAYLATLKPSVPPDVTPDAVNWADISGEVFGTNANQTISGINTPISLSWTRTGSALVQARVNDGSPQSSPVSVSNGDTVSFSASSGSAQSGTVTVRNESDGSTVLDTFNYDITEISES